MSRRRKDYQNIRGKRERAMVKDGKMMDTKTRAWEEVVGGKLGGKNKNEKVGGRCKDIKHERNQKVKYDIDVNENNTNEWHKIHKWRHTL